MYRIRAVQLTAGPKQIKLTIICQMSQWNIDAAFMYRTSLSDPVPFLVSPSQSFSKVYLDCLLDEASLKTGQELKVIFFVCLI